jgi:hypothetical protein
MFRTITVVLALSMLPLATSADAQVRGNGRDRRDVARAQGVPPGQLPPPDMCRVWYNGRPPGQQPRATSCQRAEATAARDRNARVIYGVNEYGRYGRYGNNRNGTYGNRYPYPDGRYPDNDRAVGRVPGRNRAPNGTIYPNYPSSSTRYGDTAFQNGYRDGREQGLEDGRDNDRFDATRHGRYRSADRGYIDSYGEKNAYKNSYRQGFKAGYDEGYRETYRR